MDELISRKAVLELPRMTQEPIKAYGKFEYINVKDVENLPTIPQTAIKHFGAMECPNCGALFYEIPMIETVLENIKAEIHEELYGDISYTDLERIEHIIDKHIRGKEQK